MELLAYISTGGSTTGAGASTTAAVAATTTSAASSDASSSTSGTGSTGNGNDNTASTGNGNGNTASTGNGNGNTASTGNGSNNTASTGNGNDNTGSTGNNSGNTGSGGANSLTLLAANVQSGSDSTGSANATAGQSDSATYVHSIYKWTRANSLSDPANFINFCTGKTLTNGLQVKTGSCNGIVMGNVPSTDNMISSIITFPGPGDTIAANQDFNISVQTQGLAAGSFTNADTTYYSAPQDLDSSGQIIGHTHVTVQDMNNNLAATTPPDPTTFTFFKGINDAGNGNGLLQAAVAGGLPAGSYRVCTMTSSSNHQPVLMPVAQRGAQDDCQKFTVTAGGGSGNDQTNTGSGSSAASSVAGSGSGSSTTAAIGSTSTGTSGSTTGQGNSGGFSGQRGNRNGGGRKARYMAREFIG